MPPKAIRSLLETSSPAVCMDGAFIGAAVSAARTRRRRVGKLPALPRQLHTPFDPTWADPARREAVAGWLAELVRDGFLLPNEVRPSLTDSNAARAVFGSAWDRAVDAEVARLTRAIGLAPDDVCTPHLWRACPGPLTGLEVSACPGVVLYPCGPHDEFAIGLPLDGTHYGVAPVFRALGAIRLPVLTLVAPQWVCAEGFLGSMLYADLEAYTDEVVGEDGSVQFPDGLVQHLANEYGIDVGTDGDERARIGKLLRFLASRPSTYADAKSVRQGSRLVRDAANSAPTPAIREALLHIVALLGLAPQQTDDQPVTSEPLDEDGYCHGTLVFTAELGGYEEMVVDDICSLNMEVGCSMASKLDGNSRPEVLRLAVADCAFTTVLATVLTRYAGAANDHHPETDARAARS